MKTGIRSVIFALLLLDATFGCVFSTFAQGSLTPSGAPAPTMKSLAQIEPRIDVLTLPGDANNQFVISNSGSYFLSGNISGVPGKNGIGVHANNVTIDLNGFTLSGNGFASGLEGIDVNSGVLGVSVRNGVIANCNRGIFAVNAIAGNFTGLTLVQNNSGIIASAGSLVKDSVARGNLNFGIGIGSNGRVENCVSTANGWGIDATGNGAQISKCVVVSNSFYGIQVVSDSIVESCIAISNKVAGIFVADRSIIRDCMVSYNTSYGINVGSKCDVKNCSAYNNGSHGILAVGDCVIAENHNSNNQGDGIHTTGTGNRIEGNQLRLNTGAGINIESGSGADVVIRNTASGNIGANYVPSLGTTFGPVQSPSVATSPVANISF